MRMPFFLSFFLVRAYIHIHVYMCMYICIMCVYTHSLPSAPPSSSQPGIFHSATPKCVLCYILCKFVPVRPSALPSFRPFAAMQAAT